MPRQGISYDEVASVCQELQGAGENVTLKRVREKLGTGSMSTIMGHVNRWTDMHPAPRSKTATVTADFQTANKQDGLMAELDRLKAQYREELVQKIDDLQAEKDDQIKTIEARLADANYAAEETDKENAKLTDQIDKLKADELIWQGERKEKIATMEQMRKDIAELKADLQTERAARIEAEKEAARYKALAEERERTALRPDIQEPTKQTTPKAATNTDKRPDILGPEQKEELNTEDTKHSEQAQGESTPKEAKKRTSKTKTPTGTKN